VSNNWSAATDPETVARRAGGRQAYNWQRQVARTVRRWRLVRLLKKYGLWRRGTLARIARELGVHRSTVSRDVHAMLHEERRDPSATRTSHARPAGRRFRRSW
jgi:hypothetical protein